MTAPPRPLSAVTGGGGAPPSPSSGEPLVIDCETCIGPSVGACDDCVVSFLLGREPDDAVVIDVGEARALRLLADADLVPHLRHQRAERGA